MKGRISKYKYDTILVGYYTDVGVRKSFKDNLTAFENELPAFMLTKHPWKQTGISTDSG